MCNSATSFHEVNITINREEEVKKFKRKKHSS